MHPKHPVRCSAVLVALGGILTIATVPLDAQQTSEYELTKPDAAYLEGFGSIRGIRELPDGRVLVSDGLGQALIIVDLEAGTADTVGRVGGGPEEQAGRASRNLPSGIADQDLPHRLSVSTVVPPALRLSPSSYPAAKGVGKTGGEGYEGRMA